MIVALRALVMGLVPKISEVRGAASHPTGESRTAHSLLLSSVTQQVYDRLRYSAIVCAPDWTRAG